MKLRNKKSHITALPEGMPPKNFRPRITQIIYYLILASIISYLIYIFGSKIFYFKEHGFVEIDRTVISSARGGKILALPVHEGQGIKAKSLLAIIDSARNCFTTMSNQHNKISYELSLNRIKLKNLNKSISDLQKIIDNDQLMRALETGPSQRSPLRKVKLDIYNKQADVLLLKHKINLQTQQVKMLAKKPSRINASPECSNETIYSPFDGIIYSVKRKLNEFSSRGEPLLILINSQANVRIEFYIPNDQLASISIGNFVDVSFPDGAATEAKIKMISSAAYDFTDREWVQSNPLEIRMRVLLEPLNTKDAEIWKRYDRMEVNVRGRK